VWAVGLGWLLLALRSRSFRTGDAALAYPLGLLAATAAATLFLADRLLGIGALVLLAVPLVALARRGDAALAAARAAARPFLYAAPGIVGLPLALGLLLHGPTATVPSSAYGDLVFYVARLGSAAQSLVPFRDLLVEGQSGTYVEGTSTFLGAALSGLPGFDAFLFQTTVSSAFVLSSLAFGLGFLAASARPAWGGSARWLAVVALLAVAQVAYPTWITESPPVAFALPLTLALFHLAREPVPTGLFVGVACAVALDLFMTKAFGLVPFAVLLAFPLVRDHLPRLERRQLLLYGGVVLGLAAAGLAFFVATSAWLVEILEPKVLPADAARGLWEQLDHRDTQAAALAFEIAGQVLLAALLFRARRLDLLAVLGAGLLGHWLVGGHGLDVTVGMAILLAALLLFAEPEVLLRQRWLGLAAAVSIALSAWFRDISGVRSGLVLSLLLAATVLAAMLGAEGGPDALPAYGYVAAAVGAGIALGLAGRPFLGALVVAVLAVLPARRAVALAAAVGAVAVTVGAAAAGDLRLSEQRVTLTTDHHDVWQRVGEVVPRDGLVFTSQTGEVVDGEHGWNYYPGVASRQLYIGGWFDSPLLVDDAERRRRLALNAAVLAGRPPGSVPLERDYGSYFAVVRRGERVPAGFEPIYANERFALYRIPS
jgi:hypothetical protein